MNDISSVKIVRCIFHHETVCVYMCVNGSEFVVTSLNYADLHAKNAFS